MKLSELTTDGALDALCALTPHIYSITSDKKVVEAAGKVIHTDGETSRYGAYLLLADRAAELLPLLLEGHREDVYGILSVLNGRTRAEIAAQRFTETFRQAREALADEELLSFFRSFTQPGTGAPSAPCAPSPG